MNRLTRINPDFPPRPIFPLRVSLGRGKFATLPEPARTLPTHSGGSYSCKPSKSAVHAAGPAKTTCASPPMNTSAANAATRGPILTSPFSPQRARKPHNPILLYSTHTLYATKYKVIGVVSAVRIALKTPVKALFKRLLPTRHTLPLSPTLRPQNA